MIVPFRVLGRTPIALAVAFGAAAFWAEAAYADTIAVSPTTLPNGQVNSAYSQTLTATPSGADPYTWTVSSGSLPAGISLSTDNSDQATLTGTPSAGGASTFTISVTDSAGDTAAAQAFTLIVNQLSPNITWAAPSDITYGTALSATQLDASADVAGSFSYVPPSGTVLNAGTNQQLRTTFTPTDSSTYKTATSTVTINVAKADTSAAVTNATAKYAQGTVSAKATLTSVATVSGGTVSFALQDGNGDQVGSAVQSGSVLNGVATANVSLSGVSVGTYTIVASYSGASNFNGSGATGTLTVTQAKPLITWKAPSAISYGTALGSSQLSATANVPGTFAYTPDLGTVLDVGAQQTLSVTFTPTDTTNYTTATATQKITVNALKPVLTLGNSAQAHAAKGAWVANYGDDHVTLSATLASSNSATVDAGTLTFTAKRGAVSYGTASATVSSGAASADLDLTGLHAGSYQVVASYGGGASFAAVAGSGTLTIKKATPTITWTTPADISYGTELSDTQLNATVTLNGAAVDGTLTYSPAAGKILSPGTQSLAVTFKPASTADFNIATMRVKLNVNAASSSLFMADLSPASGAKTAKLTAHLASSAAVSGGTVKFTVSSGGTPVWTATASVSNGLASATMPISGLPAGSYAITASYGGNTKFAACSGTATLTIS